MESYFKAGAWNAICGVCGFKFKSSELRPRWDGLRVCSEDFEFRNEQDFIKIPRDASPIPWSSPDSVVFLFDDLLTETSETLCQEDAYLLGLESND